MKTPTGLAIGDGDQRPNLFNIFVKVDGIDGESDEKNHTDWLEALASIKNIDCRKIVTLVSKQHLSQPSGLL